MAAIALIYNNKDIAAILAGEQSPSQACIDVTVCKGPILNQIRGIADGCYLLKLQQSQSTNTEAP